MNLSLFTSKATWSIIAMFIVGGLEAIGVLSTGAGITLQTILGIGGIAGHNSDIKAGRGK